MTGPLAGWRVAVTRSAHQSEALSSLLVEAGAEPVEVPTIAIADPADGGSALVGALARLSQFEWVAFTSANAVSRVVAALGDPQPLAQVRVAAVGEATAAALSVCGVTVEAMPEKALGGELAAVMGPAGRSARVLLPQAAGARDALRCALVELGYEVESVEVYRTVHAPRDAVLARDLLSCDAVTFASPSSIDGFLSAYGRDALPPVVVTIGPVTTEAAVAAGIAVSAEAGVASAEGLVTALAVAADS